MRIGLLAASLALLGSGALAAQSAIAIQHGSYATPMAAHSPSKRAVTVVSWNDSDELRRLALR